MMNKKKSSIIFHGLLLRFAAAIVVVGVIFLLKTAAAAAPAPAPAPAQEEEEDDECKPVSCPAGGPLISFPFWLKDYQPKRCGYPHPNFQLSCSSSSSLFNSSTKSTSTSTTALELIYYVHYSYTSFYPSSKRYYIPLKFYVQKIDYTNKRVHISVDYKSFCLPKSPHPQNNNNNTSHDDPITPPTPLLKPNEEEEEEYLISLWNCSSSSWKYGNQYSGAYFNWLLISCLSSTTGPSYKVIAATSHYFNNDDILTTCEKMYHVYFGNFPLFRFQDKNYQILKWSTPLCANCEAQGNICRSKSSNYEDDPHQMLQCSQKGKSRTWVIVVMVVGGTLVLLLVVSSVVYLIMRLKKKKEDQKKIEKFLEDYKALRPSRFSYADIKKITNNFKDKLGEGGYGTVFKGNIYNDNNKDDSNCIPVAVKVLHNFKGDNGEEFVNEVSTIGTIHHVNVVRLIGYCADGCRGALLYEFLSNGSLEKLLSSRKLMNSILGNGNWAKICEIAIGVAKGLDYLHQGCNQRILHFDIKPQNILLDENLNPKVSDFGLAKLCSKDQSAVSMTAARGTIGYIAPEVFSRNFGNVSYKSDVYSFGMLLVDMVGGRNTNNNGNGNGNDNGSSQMYFPEGMYKMLEKGEDIKIQIEGEGEEGIGDEESVKILFKKIAMVGLWCIQWCPADRPTMKVAIQMLEAENLPEMPPNPFGNAASRRSKFIMTSISEEIHESDIEN